MDPEAFAKHTHWVVERHTIWLKRQRGEPGPWTEDPILATRKFTNVFRILDPGTQFVFRLAHPDPRTELLRLFLYRHTGRVAAWQALDAYPTADTLADTLTAWQDYRTTGGRVFTGAYNVHPQGAGHGSDKLVAIMDLTRRVFQSRLATDFLTATSQSERFAVLRQPAGVGDFMAMQILTDWGYTQHCSEDREHDFIAPGPGTRRGAALVCPGTDPEDTVRRLAEWWRSDGRVYLDLPDGTRRYPSMADVGNVLCELSKYNRYAPGRVAYTPAHPGAQPAPEYPQHWMKGTTP